MYTNAKELYLNKLHQQPPHAVNLYYYLFASSNESGQVKAYIGDICKSLGYSSATFAKYIKRLVKLGLVSKEIEPNTYGRFCYTVLAVQDAE